MLPAACQRFFILRRRRWIVLLRRSSNPTGHCGERLPLGCSGWTDRECPCNVSQNPWMEQSSQWVPKDKHSPPRCAAFLARRQRGIQTTATCALCFAPTGKEAAGLAVVQAMNHQVRVELTQSQGRQVLRAVVVTTDFEVPPYLPGFTCQTNTRVAAEIPWETDKVILQIQLDGQRWTIRCGQNLDHLIDLAVVDGRELNPEKVGGMVGTMIGMFATGNGISSQNYAHFYWYRQTQP